MKRCEMIKIIENNFGGDIREYAGEILNVIEEAGMLPPDSDNTVFGFNEGYISPPKWESEDEEK